jgi:hypothetical protein
MVEPFSDLDARPVATAHMGSFFGVAETGAQVIYEDVASQLNIDIERGAVQDLALMVNRGTSSEDTSRLRVQKESKYTNLAYGWPLIETPGSITSAELFKRELGQSEESRMSHQARLSAKAMKIHKEHFKQHITTHEYLCRESVWTGFHPAILGTSSSDLQYDFLRNSGNFITAGTQWTTTSSDILGDLDAGADKIQQNGGLHGDYGLLVDGTVFGGIKNNDTTGADADNRRYQFAALGGEVSLPTEFERYRANGFQPRGRLETNGGRIVWVFTYDLTFTDNFTDPDNPTNTPWVPATKGLMFSPKARCDKYYGPMDHMPITAQEAEWYRQALGFDMNAVPQIPQVQNTNLIDPRMFYCFASPGRKSIELLTQSAPVFPTTQTDGFVTFSNLSA